MFEISIIHLFPLTEQTANIMDYAVTRRHCSFFVIQGRQGTHPLTLFLNHVWSITWCWLKWHRLRQFITPCTPHSEATKNIVQPFLHIGSSSSPDHFPFCKHVLKLICVFVLFISCFFFCNNHSSVEKMVLQFQVVNYVNYTDN